MRTCVAILVLLGTMRAAADEPAVRIVPERDDPSRVVVICRLSPAAAADLATRPPTEADGRRHLVLSLFDEKAGEAGPPIFAKYEAAAGKLTLRPAFGLVRGATYRAIAVDRTTGRTLGVADYHVPETAATSPTVVQQITPSGKTLPANVLRFYITFSRPMREGREVLERIKLFDDAGTEIRSPWRDLELWNADATRLSLFLHPGRIKQGVNLREQLGPILLPNRKYAVVIGGDLRDAAGRELGRDFRHEFATTDEIRTRIDVAAWRIGIPAAGTREPLRIEFERPLDAALALRRIKILDAAGNETPGEAELTNGERVRIFTPTAPWRAAGYVVAAEPTLEDQAGNSPVRVFDTDLSEPQVEILPPQLRREFTPR